MNKDVIEQQIKEWLRAEEIYDVGEVGVAYGDCARQLQAATRPEQFMPRLDKWPEDAVAIRLDEKRPPFFNNIWDKWEFSFAFADEDGYRVSEIEVNIPPGIDPRIKVSREQMEEYEAMEKK